MKTQTRRSELPTAIRCAMRYARPAILVLGLAACGREDAGRRPATGDTAGSPAQPVAAPVTLHSERSYDLTGDDRPERVSVNARGPAYDSLTVRLEIRSPADSVLYATRWSSFDYFKYEPRAGKADSTVARIVRGHLERVLVDSAFSPAGTLRRLGSSRPVVIDTGSIRYDEAARRWRASHAWPDSTPLPPRAEGELRPADVPAELVTSLASELRGKPTFTFHAGGELTYTIAWSDRARRFVIVSSCC